MEEAACGGGGLHVGVGGRTLCWGRWLSQGDSDTMEIPFWNRLLADVWTHEERFHKPERVWTHEERLHIGVGFLAGFVTMPWTHSAAACSSRTAPYGRDPLWSTL